MARSHAVHFSPARIRQAVTEIAQAIDRDADSAGLVVVTVLKGAVMFSSDLVRAMSTETELAYVTASSYSGGFTPGETISVDVDLDVDVSGRDVLIVDDIIDTGRTLQTIVQKLEQLDARRVRTATLVDKNVRRSSTLAPTYTGFRIGEEFIYGYGLDWNERYRDLPFIALAGGGPLQ